MLNLNGFARGEETALGVDGGRVDQHHSFSSTLRTKAMKTHSAQSRWRAAAGMSLFLMLSKGKAVRFAELTSALEHVLIPVRGRDDAQALWG